MYIPPKMMENKRISAFSITKAIESIKRNLEINYNPKKQKQIEKN